MTAVRHFCLMCGAPMEVQRLEGREREQCPACGWVYYLHLKLGAGVLVVHEGRLLLLKRAHHPWKGAWNLPAGYVEVDESPEQAAMREVREETGLEVALDRLLGNYFFDDDPRGNGLLAVFLGRPVSGELTVTDETAEYGYFSPDELPDPLCGAAHDQLILSWADGEFNQ